MFQVSAENSQTIATSTTASAAFELAGSRAVVVAVGADVFVDINENPNPTDQCAIVPAGVPIAFTFGSGQSISVKAIAGTGYVTVYPF